MRQLILICFLFLSFGSLIAQTPQPIYGFAVEKRPVSWYLEQAKLWKLEVDKNPRDGNAWACYYRVTRNLLSCDTISKLSRAERLTNLRNVLEAMEKAIPDSYEYNYCKFSFEGNNFDFLRYLKRADELSNGRILHLDYMINWSEVERNIDKRDKYCKMIYEAGNYSPGFMYYNYNVLIGLKPNAILFTAGDNDTYPIWLLQALGYRKDVTVINLYLIRLDDYRKKVFDELKVEKWDLPKDSDGYDIPSEIKRFEEGIVKHVAANKKLYPVYLGLTASATPIEKIEENLYLVGLAYEYSNEPIDNMAIMKKNFEQRYTLDYIDKPFYKDLSMEIVKNSNANYEIPLLKLFDHYKESGDLQKTESVKTMLINIAQGREEYSEILEHVNKK